MSKQVDVLLKSILPGTCSDLILNKNPKLKAKLYSPHFQGLATPIGEFYTTIPAFEYIYGIVCSIQGLPPAKFTVKSSELVHITYDLSKYLLFMTNKIPYGTSDREDQSNVVCRQLHLQLAFVDPNVHCKHVGRSGGGACTDKTAQSYYKRPDVLKCAYKRP
ncbi:unnamed protein product [Didymodactylos carnosus]|uniref:Uncharacterized protein n=1 Tax=Didymodactylos carnosus TaxID=1234261 RepID=A0A814RIR1_9BILA|nr:unnamed protein product [Didymodactylos carnosus]CAF3898219.1 unnamed protein product [Didymodactylos carnosus]